MSDFFIVTPVRNARAWVGRCIASAKAQTHRQWRMVVIDDASDDGTADVAESAIAGDPRITLVRNAERRYSLRNMVTAIDRYSRHDSIVCCLDGDDRLSDDRALEAVAAEYDHDPGLDALWTRHEHGDGNTAPLCRAIAAGVRPIDSDWRSSHMKTFRKWLIWGVDRRVWSDDVGQWRRCACDVALYLPMLQLARNYKFLPRVCYTYNRGSERDHAHAEQAVSASSVWRSLRESERRRTLKRHVLFFVNGVNGGDARFAWRPGCARTPMGALTLMARLRARGHVVSLCDRYLNRNGWPERDALKQADVIAVYASTPNHADALHILRTCRRETDARLIAGGPHASVAPHDLTPLCDAVCQGEADDAILDLVETSSHGLMNAGRFHNLNAVPFPAHGYVRERKLGYRADWPFGPQRNVWVLNTSRGCPHQCAFCDTRLIMGRLWYGADAERMINDVRELERVTDADAVYFREDNFACSPSRLKTFCAQYQRSGLALPWACELRADRASQPGVLEMMRDAGCVGLYLGIESGSQPMLDRFRKGTTVEQNRVALDLARRLGMKAAASLVVNHPDETPDDRAATEALIRETQPAQVWRNTYRAPRDV